MLLSSCLLSVASAKSNNRVHPLIKVSSNLASDDVTA